MIEKSPTFQFWDSVMGLEKLILTFVRAHRERNFEVYMWSNRRIFFCPGSLQLFLLGPNSHSGHDLILFVKTSKNIGSWPRLATVFPLFLSIRCMSRRMPK